MLRVPADAPMLSVGQLSARSGVSVSALHFYERQGLIVSSRTDGNQRRYGREALRRVAFIRASQNVGIPLKTIRQALDGLPGGRAPNRRDWERLSRTWKTELDLRIRQLQQLRDELSSCIGCGCLSLDKCALYNRADLKGTKRGRASTLLTSPALSADIDVSPASDE